MCGLAGIVGNRVDRRELQAMVASQHHRGPDAEGTYFDPDGLAGLGHNRLSIIDLSSAGRQLSGNLPTSPWASALRASRRR